MVSELRVDVTSVLRELEVVMRVLTESRIVSRYRRIFKGRGLEFEDFREYTTSDDATRIDWMASKRANKLLIRLFKEERDINVFFMVDVSRSMLFGSTKKLKHEYAAELVTALSHFVLESGDKVGLLLFSDKVMKYVEPAKGTKHFYIMLKNLLTPEFYGGGYNLTNALDFLMNTVQDRSIVFIVSDFIGLEKDWEKIMKQSSAKFDGVAIMVRDPRDENLPAGVGQMVIADPYSEGEILIDCNDKAKRSEYERYVRNEKENIRATLKVARWDLLEVSTKEGFVSPLIRFLKRREILFR